MFSDGDVEYTNPSLDEVEADESIAETFKENGGQITVDVETKDVSYTEPEKEEVPVEEVKEAVEEEASPPAEELVDEITA